MYVHVLYHGKYTVHKLHRFKVDERQVESGHFRKIDINTLKVVYCVHFKLYFCNVRIFQLDGTFFIYNTEESCHDISTQNHFL